MILLFMLVAIIFFMIASAFFSASETAYTSVDKLLVDSVAKKNKPQAKLAKKLLDNQTKLLTTTLVGNNLTLIIATSLATYIFKNILYDELHELVTTVVMTPLLLIFAEVTPKTIARNNSLSYVFRSAVLLSYLQLFFAPIISVILYLTKILLKIMGIKNIDNMISTTREEIKVMADISAEEGLIGKKEHNMINRVFGLNQTTVSSAMKPLVELHCFDIKSSLSAVLSNTNSNNFFPVFKARPDNIVGMIFLNDVLKMVSNSDCDLDNTSIAKLVNLQIPFIPENRMVASLLNEFQSKQIPILFAIDEYGGVSGMITISDLAEEITSDFSLNHDSKKPKIINHTGGIDCEGRVDVDILAEQLNLVFDKDGYDTVAGYILKLEGRVPAVNECFEYQGYRFTVLKATRKRIVRVRITKI